jgi:hypothetical protein
MGRKRLPPAVQSLFADLQERLEERSLTPINSVMDQPIPELVQTVPALKGLDVASPPPPGGLPGILKWAGAMVDKFFRDFTNTAATEILRQTRLTKNGKPKEARSEQFYYVFINRSEQGHSWMEEFRANQQGQQIVPGGLEKGFMATSGFATSLVVLHPKWQPSLDYRFLGRQPVSGHPAYVLGFAQRPEVSPALGAFRLGQQKVVPLHMQGIAWISADRHQVLHLRTDLLEPVPKIGLTRETTEIDYRPHRFASSPQPFWLPSRVTVSVDWGGKRLCNEHIFSKFRLFKVEVETEQAGATHDVAGATGKPSSN